VTVEYSDIQGGEAGIITNGQGPVHWSSGNLDTSPRFVHAGLGNYRLADNSPAIGAGKADGASSTDLEGNPRPNPAGSHPDMGAYESPHSSAVLRAVYLPLISRALPPPPQRPFWAERYRLDPGECTTLHWSVTNVQAVYLNDEGVPEQGGRVVCPVATTVYVLRVVRTSGTQEYRLTIVVDDDNSWVGVDADGNFYRGNPDATVKLEEFMDFQCPYSARHALQTGPLLDEAYIATGEVLQVFRNFPLNGLHSNAVRAAKAAYCAGQQSPELFWTMYHWLFENQGDWNSSSDPSAQFRSSAVIAGADGPRLDACIANLATEAHIQHDVQEGVARGLRAVPTFFINEWVIVGAVPFAEFQDKIEKAKRGLVPTPTPTPALRDVESLDAHPARPGVTYEGSPVRVP
jgi:protein-disulfide isomerase